MVSDCNNIANRKKNRTAFSISVNSLGRFSALAAFLIGALALAGWIFGIEALQGINPHWPPMRPITAISFLASALALALLQSSNPVFWQVCLSRVLAVAVSALGLVNLTTYSIELWTGRDWSIPENSIFHPFLSSGERMAINTAILFSIFGCVLLLQAARGRRSAGISHVLLLPVAIVSHLTLVGYILNVPGLYDWIYLGMALNAGVAFCALCLASFCARPDTWLMRVFTGVEAGATMARKLLLPLLILPLAIGWLRLYGERSGLFGSDIGVSLVVVAYTVCFLFLVWLSAKSVNTTDQGRRQAEGILRENEERFRLLFQQAAVGIKRVSAEGHLLEVNGKFCDILGYTQEELLQLSLKDITYPEDLKSELAELSRLLSGEIHSYAIEKRCLRKDGGIIWVRVTSSLPSGMAGPAQWWISVVENITERKQAEDALSQNEQRLRTILDALPIGIFLSDREGNVMFTNSAVGKIWGISTHVRRDQYGEYKGRWLDSGKAVDPDDWALAKTLESGEPFTNNPVELVGEEGARKIVHNFSLPIRDDSNQLTGAIVVTEDVTARVLSEEQIRVAKEAAEEAAAELARSNEDLQQFAYVASHDLQEPLRAVAGFMGILRRQYADKLDAEAQEYISYAVEGAERMQALINDLLTFSRVGTKGGSFKPMDMKEALESAMSNLQIAIEESNALIIADSLPRISADAMQMTQLLQNLIANAIKFRGQRRAEIHISAEQGEHQWIFGVRDNGIGMEPQYFDRIFLIFQRLHSRTHYPGTGIGLAVCKKIVERHGGTIWVDSKPGEGSTFHFSIPDEGDE